MSWIHVCGLLAVILIVCKHVQSGQSVAAAAAVHFQDRLNTTYASSQISAHTTGSLKQNIASAVMTPINTPIIPLDVSSVRPINKPIIPLGASSVQQNIQTATTVAGEQQLNAHKVSQPSAQKVNQETSISRVYQPTAQDISQQTSADVINHQTTHVAERQKITSNINLHFLTSKVSQITTQYIPVHQKTTITKLNQQTLTPYLKIKYHNTTTTNTSDKAVTFFRNTAATSQSDQERTRFTKDIEKFNFSSDQINILFNKNLTTRSFKPSTHKSNESSHHPLHTSTEHTTVKVNVRDDVNFVTKLKYDLSPAVTNVTKLESIWTHGIKNLSTPRKQINITSGDLKLVSGKTTNQNQSLLVNVKNESVPNTFSEGNEKTFGISPSGHVNSTLVTKVKHKFGQRWSEETRWTLPGTLKGNINITTGKNLDVTVGMHVNRSFSDFTDDNKDEKELLISASTTSVPHRSQTTVSKTEKISEGSVHGKRFPQTSAKPQTDSTIFQFFRTDSPSTIRSRSGQHLNTGINRQSTTWSVRTHKETKTSERLPGSLDATTVTATMIQDTSTKSSRKHYMTTKSIGIEDTSYKDKTLTSDANLSPDRKETPITTKKDQVINTVTSKTMRAYSSEVERNVAYSSEVEKNVAYSSEVERNFATGKGSSLTSQEIRTTKPSGESSELSTPSSSQSKFNTTSTTNVSNHLVFNTTTTTHVNNHLVFTAGQYDRSLYLSPTNLSITNQTSGLTGDTKYKGPPYEGNGTNNPSITRSVDQMSIVRSGLHLESNDSLKHFNIKHFMLDKNFMLKSGQGISLLDVITQHNVTFVKTKPITLHGPTGYTAGVPGNTSNKEVEKTIGSTSDSPVISKVNNNLTRIDKHPDARKMTSSNTTNTSPVVILSTNQAPYKVTTSRDQSSIALSTTLKLNVIKESDISLLNKTDSRLYNTTQTPYLEITFKSTKSHSLETLSIQKSQSSYYLQSQKTRLLNILDTAQSVKQTVSQSISPITTEKPQKSILLTPSDALSKSNILNLTSQSVLTATTLSGNMSASFSLGPLVSIKSTLAKEILKQYDFNKSSLHTLKTQLKSPVTTSINTQTLITSTTSNITEKYIKTTKSLLPMSSEIPMKPSYIKPSASKSTTKSIAPSSTEIKFDTTMLSDIDNTLHQPSSVTLYHHLLSSQTQPVTAIKTFTSSISTETYPTSLPSSTEDTLKVTTTPTVTHTRPTSTTITESASPRSTSTTITESASSRPASTTITESASPRSTMVVITKSSAMTSYTLMPSSTTEKSTSTLARSTATDTTPFVTSAVSSASVPADDRDTPTTSTPADDRDTPTTSTPADDIDTPTSSTPSDDRDTPTTSTPADDRDTPTTSTPADDRDTPTTSTPADDRDTPTTSTLFTPGTTYLTTITSSSRFSKSLPSSSKHSMTTSFVSTILKSLPSRSSSTMPAAYNTTSSVQTLSSTRKSTPSTSTKSKPSSYTMSTKSTQAISTMSTPSSSTMLTPSNTASSISTTSSITHFSTKTSSTITSSTSKSTTTITSPISTARTTTRSPTSTASTTITSPTSTASTTMTSPTSTASTTIKSPTSTSTASTTITSPTSTANTTITSPKSTARTTTTSPTSTASTTITSPTSTASTTMTSSTSTASTTIKSPTSTSTASTTITSPTSTANTTITSPTSTASTTITSPTSTASTTMTSPTSTASTTITSPTSTASTTMKSPTSTASTTMTSPTSTASTTITSPTSTSSTTMISPTSTASTTITSPTSTASITMTSPTSTASTTMTSPTSTASTTMTSPTSTASTTITSPTSTASTTMTSPTSTASTTMTSPTSTASTTITSPTPTASTTITSPTSTSASTTELTTTSTTKLPEPIKLGSPCYVTKDTCSNSVKDSVCIQDKCTCIWYTYPVENLTCKKYSTVDFRDSCIVNVSRVSITIQLPEILVPTNFVSYDRFISWSSSEGVGLAQSYQSNMYNLTNLRPGTVYFIKVVITIKSPQDSYQMFNLTFPTLTALTDPPEPGQIENNTDLVNSIIFKQPIGKFDSCTASVVELSLFNQSVGGTQWFKFNCTHLNIDNLKSGVNYNVSVCVNVSDGVHQTKSSPWKFYFVSLNEREPGKVEGLLVVNITSTSVMVSWSQPKQMNGYLTAYEIKLRSDNNLVCTAILLQNSPNSFTVAPMRSEEKMHNVTCPIKQEGRLENITLTFLHLKLASDYIMSVSAHNRYHVGKETSMSFTTTSEDPMPPINVQSSNRTNTSVVIRWTPPVRYPGPTNYIIEIINTTQVYHVQGYSSNSITINNLPPGTCYSVQISSNTSTSTSAPAQIDCVCTLEAKPDKVKSLTATSQTESIQLTWSTPDQLNGRLMGYVIYICTSNICRNETLIPTNLPLLPQKIQMNVGQTCPYTASVSATKSNINQYTLQNLLSCEQYNISVAAFNGAGAGALSKIIVRTATTVPPDPQFESCMSEVPGSITFRWQQFQKTKCLISYNLKLMKGNHLASSINDVFTVANITVTSSTLIRFDQLTIYWPYRLLLTAFTTSGSSRSVQSDVCRSKSDDPGPVRNVSISSLSDNNYVNVTWECPMEQDRHGEIAEFHVSITVTSTLRHDLADGLVKKSETSVVPAGSSPCQQTYRLMTRIFPQVVYRLQIRAKVNDVYELGVAFNRRIQVTAQAPRALLKTDNPVRYWTSPNSPNDSSMSVSLRLSTLLDNSQGEIVAFGLIVYVCPDEVCSSDQPEHYNKWPDFYSKHLTWSQAKEKSFTQKYRTTDATWERRVLNSHAEQISEVNYTVGDNTTCERSNQLDYCNGPLPTVTYFRLELFSCTVGGCTSISLPRLFYSAAPHDDSSSDSIVIGGAVGGMTLAVVVLIIVVVIRLRSKLSKLGRQKKTSELSQTIALSDIEVCKDDGKSKPIKIREFESNVLKLTANDNTLLNLEYQELDELSPIYPMDVGSDLDHRADNRWTNIIPFDHSRVKLKVFPEDSHAQHDYINANFISGADSTRDYIATQGPLVRTVADFWRMVWEQKVSVIVMLSDFEEMDKRTSMMREKVARYYPDDVESNPVQYGHMMVTRTGKLDARDWEIRTLKLTSTQEKKSRFVKHFFFKYWSDHEADINPHDLIEFVRVVRTETSNEPPSPLVVHCSAGVGRTGTFIAVDYFNKLISRMKQRVDKGASASEMDNWTVDIFGRVLSMREKRRYMVQSRAQYAFIYKAVKALLTQAFCPGEHSTDKHTGQTESSDPAKEDAVYDDVESLKGQVHVNIEPTSTV